MKTKDHQKLIIAELVQHLQYIESAVLYEDAQDRAEGTRTIIVTNEGFEQLQDVLKKFTPSDIF